MSGDRLNKAVVEKAGCLYSCHFAKRALPGRGPRASEDKCAGSEGLGDRTIAGEAKGASVLPGQGPTCPLDSERRGICGRAVTNVSVQGLGSARATSWALLARVRSTDQDEV